MIRSDSSENTQELLYSDSYEFHHDLDELTHETVGFIWFFPYF